MPRSPRPRLAKPMARPQRKQRVYAIAFDLDTIRAKAIFGEGNTHYYAQIASVLAEFGFAPTQGSLYFGDDTSDAVRCVMAVQALDRRFEWFARIVRDLRMLRVDEDNDLLPALSNELRLGDMRRVAND